MDRRNMLKQSSYALAGMATLPALSVLLESCAIENTDGYTPAYLHKEEYEMVWALAETILPRTETPGAADVGVAAYIDLLFGEYFDKEVAEQHRSQLQNLMEDCLQKFGKVFTALEEENQHAFLNEQDAAEESFFRHLKNLMLWAYFTSEEGTKSMDYNPIPGKYQGCYTLTSNGKNLVGNSNYQQVRGRYGQFEK